MKWHMKGGLKKPLILSVLPAILLAALIIAAVWFALPGTGPEAAAVADIPLGFVSPNFPRDIPIEEGAILVSNFDATSTEGRVQSTRVFESLESASSNFDTYKAFLADPERGWTILGEVNDPDHKAIFAEGREGILNVNISTTGLGAASIVDISFTTRAG